MSDARREPWPSIERQHEADRLGMCLFLSSELMLFGTIFVAFFALIAAHPAEIHAASARLNMWLGALNTAVLLTSSLLVAIGVEAGPDRPGRIRWSLLAAAALGLCFLGVKAIEYTAEYHEGLMPGTAPVHFDSGAHRLFMDLYFTATALHALHLAIGVILLTVLALRQRSHRPPARATLVNAGLYWHLVDVIWVFLYPVLYLTRV